MADKVKRKWGYRIPLIALAMLLAIVLGYLLYVVCSYSRIPDRVEVPVSGTPAEQVIRCNASYVAVTQNIGFGAYTQDFTFFMDGGTQSRAASAESVRASVNAAIAEVASHAPDIIFFQEVDLSSTRSHHVNQYDMLTGALDGYSHCYAVNYDSAYLFYPILSPHGASYSSMATFSRFGITSSLRRSFPISTSFSKFLDLDRCYNVSRIPVENGKELVLYNVHSSAYGGSDEIRTAQMTMLFDDMAAEYAQGNYVICGGDFNHDFTGDSTKQLNGGETVDYGWAQPFPAELLPEGIRRCTNYTSLSPTCRNCDVPYKAGNFTIIVDGFLVSDNVVCEEVENVMTDFTYSDHNPVRMTFKLK